jgi:hypothetical protein
LKISIFAYRRVRSSPLFSASAAEHQIPSPDYSMLLIRLVISRIAHGSRELRRRKKWARNGDIGMGFSLSTENRLQCR